MDEIMEIVAPAGNIESLKASINAGAKAVYLGLKGFGARRKAGNFTVEELVEAIDYAHSLGVRTYLTLNTIMKDSEIKAIYTNLKKLYNEGLDAIIVQDFGMFSFLKENFPELEIHGSTQMTVSNYKEAEYLRKQGFKRVVLSRELSFEEIKSIKEKSKIELEVFVSGSLCVSYSGKCYFSSYLGGRSGNRGLCAQPCRRLYTRSGDKEYSLSPKDQLYAKEEIARLKEIGIESIKVEGRMKNPEYVYEMVKHFDNILKGIKEKRYPEKLFNRAYSKGYFYGDNENLINKEYSFDFGVKIAELKNNKIELIASMRTGDGVSFVDKNKKVITGTYINKIVKGNKIVKQASKGETVSIGILPNGVKEIYKTYDKDLNDKISKEIKEEIKTPIKAKLYLELNKEIRLEIENKLEKVIVNGTVAEEAKKTMDSSKIREKISEIGDSKFYFEKIDLIYDEKSFISFKELKEMKRRAVEEFELALKKHYKRDMNKEYSDTEIQEEPKDKKFELAVKVKTKKQYEIVKKMGIDKIYMDSYELIKEENLNEKNISYGDLVKTISHIYDKNKKTIDNTMNVFNQRSFNYFEKLKQIETIYFSQECSFDQMSKIKARRANKAFVIYTLPKVMYIEHKISDKDYEEIENEYDDKVILIKNKFSNTEVYLKEAFNVIDKIDELRSIGLNELRIDFSIETEEEIKKILTDVKKKESKYKPYNFEKGVL